MRIKLFVVLIVVLSIMGSVFAQETIGIGDDITGNLTSGERDEYTFEASMGDFVQIDLMSDDFDSYLYLLNSRGTQLTYNDDGGDGLNSRIAGFSIPEDGTYTIQAASISDNEGGAYTLSLRTVENDIIEYGEVVSQDVSEGIPVYMIDMRAGDVVVVDLFATEGYDTYIEMNTPFDSLEYGNYINELHARLGPYTVDETGTYTLNITAGGTYTLSVNTISPTPLTLGEETIGTFGEGVNALYFAIENDGTNIVDITVDSGNALDTRMELVGIWGYVEQQIDDAPGSVDPALSQILLDQFGTYYLIVSPAKPAARLSGDVNVTVARSVLPSLDDGPVEIAFDYDTNDQIFTFEGTAGETVNLTVTVDTEEEWSSPTIELNQNGENFASINSTGLKQFTAQVEIPSTGTVNVIARAYSIMTMNIQLGRSLE